MRPMLVCVVGEQHLHLEVTDDISFCDCFQAEFVVVGVPGYLLARDARHDLQLLELPEVANCYHARRRQATCDGPPRQHA